MIFNLPSELNDKVQYKDIFYAVRCGNGKMVLAGAKGSIEVPGTDIKLGEKFAVTKTGGLVLESMIDQLEKEPVKLKLVPALTKEQDTVLDQPKSRRITSYKQLAKGKRRK